MSTYTDLHTRRRENLTILRMPGDPNDGITPQRVILANPENIYEGTFKGKIDSSGATFNIASLNDCTINGGAISNATIYSDGMEVSIADLTTDISEIAGQLDTALNDIDGLKTVSANLAYAIASAASSVETISSSLSSISAYAVSSANAYADGLFDGLSFTMSNLIEDVSARIELSAKEYVDSKIDNGLSVPTISVYGDAIVNASYGPSNGTLVAIAQNGISAKTAAGIEVEADDSICAIAGKNIALTGNKLLGSFDNGISISTDNGLDSIQINGNSIQHTLNALSTALDQKKLDIIVAGGLSNKIYDDIANCRYLQDISVSLQYQPNDREIILSAGNRKYSISTDDFVKDGMLQSVSCLTDISGRPYLHFTWNTAASSQTTDVYLDQFVYTASNGIVLSGNDFRLDPSTISSINSAIVVGGHFEPNQHEYDSLSAFFAACIGNDPQYVKNNSIYTVFLTEGYALVDIDDSIQLSIGDYDTILVHDHNFGSIVDLSALRYASNVNSNGNVYLFKQGGEGADKSAIEEEARIRQQNDDYISSWISTNFANTGDADVSPVTIVKQDLCASHDISVASNAYERRDYRDAGSQYDNEAIIDFKNTRDVWSMSSIADLCLALSTSISSLSDSTIESDKVLSTSIDSKIIVDGISAESLSAQHISQEDYYNLVSTDSTISNVLYIVSSDHVNVYGQQIKNVAQPTDLSDAATKGYIDSSISNSLSNFYKKSETSSAVELSSALTSLADVLSTKLEQDDVNISYHDQKIWLSSKSHVTSVDCIDFIKDGMLSTVELCGTTLIMNFNTDAGSDPISVELSNFVDNYDDKISSLSDTIDNKIFVSDSISGISGYSDLSVVKLGANEYASLLTSDALLSNAIYIIKDDYIDAYGQQMKNLAAPSDLSDAATKGYVDNVSGDVQSIVSTIYDSLISIDNIASFNENSNLSVAINAIVTIRDTLSSLKSSLANIIV